MPKDRGRKRGRRSYITPEIADYIKAHYEDESYASMSKKFGICGYTISNFATRVLHVSRMDARRRRAKAAAESIPKQVTTQDAMRAFGVDENHTMRRLRARGYERKAHTDTWARPDAPTTETQRVAILRHVMMGDDIRTTAHGAQVSVGQAWYVVSGYLRRDTEKKINKRKAKDEYQLG